MGLTSSPSEHRPAPPGRSLDIEAIHRAYGMVLRSDCAIPGIPTLDLAVTPDLVIRFVTEPGWLIGARAGVMERWPKATSSHDDYRSARKIWTVDGGNYLRVLYRDGTEFFISPADSEIWAEWIPPLTLEDMAVYLLGPILGFYLALRGTTSLHASAVMVDGTAVALLGSARAGKSTTAAAFFAHGFAVLSDDVLPIDVRLEAIEVRSAYPSIKLWPESSEILFGHRALPLLAEGWEKGYLELKGTDSFRSESAGLGAIYHLAGRSSDPRAPFIESLSSSDALVTLVGNTYSNFLLDSAMRASEFNVLSRVVADVPVRRVTPHADPDRLDDLFRLIVSDFRNLRANGIESAD